jgi:hypothetical protein
LTTINPILHKIPGRKPRSILSRALLIWIFKADSPLRPLVFIFNAWITSLAIRALSWIDHPTTKVNCSWETRLSRHLFNLLANTLEIILYKILQRDIGRKYFIIVGLSHLRIRHMLICLIEANRKVPSMQPYVFVATKISSPYCF